MRVLLVEDDRMIGQSLEHALQVSGYAVNWIERGDDAEEALHDDGYTLVLLDLGLPGKSGLELLRALRRRGSSMPVIIMTARDSVAERVSGLDAGADDYLAKPFAVQELQARMRAVTRRKSGNPNPVLGNGEIELDPATREARFHGHRAVLSAREFALLHALLERPGNVLSRSQLEDKIYGWNEEVESNAVEVLIHYLRRKFGPDLIRNIRGVGWMVAGDQ